LDPWGLGVSFIYKLYSVGARTEPCGTPASISLGVDSSPSTETLNFLWDRYEPISFIKLTESCNFDNLYNKPGCHVVSKAFSMSKNTASLSYSLGTCSSNSACLLQVFDVLWSDPQPSDGCIPNSLRGAGTYFGPDVTENFLQKYRLLYLIRSHECKPGGYELTHSSKVRYLPSFVNTPRYKALITLNFEAK